LDRPTIARRGSSPVSAGAGTAAAQGPLWGEHAGDWAAVQEPQLDAVYRAVLDALPVAGRRVLDIGCGAGRFLELAVAAGADVDGLDASPALVAEAHGRLPGARLVVGEMQRLPYADATFEVVTGFNTFQWAADRVAAIGEAARTLRPDGRLVVAVW
jgi:ubiquinone/menaquinone biosynthesis C-methylase UbiE